MPMPLLDSTPRPLPLHLPFVWPPKIITRSFATTPSPSVPCAISPHGRHRQTRCSRCLLLSIFSRRPCIPLLASSRQVAMAEPDPSRTTVSTVF
uniref:Uncharacterized protein n=1 Tax=Arundo donax TaxID=35708 RepID=A0A0A9B6R6_ARUDO